MATTGDFTGEVADLYAVRLVGAFRVTNPAGEDVTPRGRRARALLAYLSLRPPHAAPRNTLADLLWSERGDEQARGSLRQALFELRALAGTQGLLHVRRTEVRLRPAVLGTDLHVFDRAAEAQDLAAMLRLFGEPDATLLGDLHDVDPAFDEWLSRQRGQWAETRRNQALRACQGPEARRQPALALRLAQLVALTDPLDEAATSTVMERAHDLGDVATIRRAFAVLSDALRRDLGVTPTAATTTLYERLVSTTAAPSVVAPVAPHVAGPPLRRSGRRGLLAMGAAIAAAIGLPLMLTAIRDTAREQALTGSARPLPRDAAAAALFLQARDDAAQRTAAGLNRAVAELQRVTRLDATFAPGYAALADAYLLGGEAGSLSRSVAFDGAEHAADRAMELDAGLPAAHRAKAFILYWLRHRPQLAGAEFRKAISLAPTEALTHFWYANVLADAGQQPAALREFDSARLQDPGSDQISTDYAWALWMFGREADAQARLDAIMAAHPENAEAQDCIGMMALSRSDDEGFLTALKRRAALRGEQTLAARAGVLDVIFRRRGSAALLAALRSDELADQQDAAYPDRSTAAFYASLAHDRPAMQHILSLAAAAHERWGAAGYVRRMRAIWADDAQVLSGLTGLIGDRVEPA